MTMQARQTQQTQQALPATPVPSPCTSVCTMNAGSGLCDGCLRTIDEIVAWGSASEADKRLVWLAIAQRQQDLFA
ncbi:MAG: DUF1289 domain-containing protein [Janthinobacterium lividum]